MLCACIQSSSRGSGWRPYRESCLCEGEKEHKGVSVIINFQLKVVVVWCQTTLNFIFIISFVALCVAPVLS